MTLSLLQVQRRYKVTAGIEFKVEYTLRSCQQTQMTGSQD